MGINQILRKSVKVYKIFTTIKIKGYPKALTAVDPTRNCLDHIVSDYFMHFSEWDKCYWFMSFKIWSWLIDF